MTRLIAIVLIVIIGSLGIQYTASGEQNAFNITGKVKGKNNFVPSGIKVAISGADFKAVTATDSNGKYSFSNIPSGRYMIKASKAGYRFEQVILTLKPGMKPSDANVNIMIIERPKDK